MKTIKWTLNTGFGSGAEHTGEFDIDDDAADDEIREACEEEVWNYLDLWWEVES